MKIPSPRSDYYSLQGGLDLVTPAISIKPGCVIDSSNYEPDIAGKYRRIDGYERFDGRASPSSASYWIVPSISPAVALGNTITGNTSGATGVVLEINTGSLVCGRVTGTFVNGEVIKVGGVPVGSLSGNVLANGATTLADHADDRLLAANDLRALIQKVPGSGAIRGVWVYNDTVYAFRDNAGATAGDMYKATAGGWVQVTFGKELKFVPRSGTVTMTIASPGVMTFNAHGAANGTPVSFGTTGALPTGITAGTTYYVVATAANTFEVAATVGGAAINTSGSQSGAHTATFQGFGTVAAGNTITGVTSTATAVVVTPLLMTGSWTTLPVGSMVFTSGTGTFSSGEALTVGGQLFAQANGASATITRLPGGQMEFDNHSFVGTTGTKKMYGCDGVNPAFEFDGTTYVPIHTGMTTDTPNHLKCHDKGHLFLAFQASVQYSGIGNPYAWTIVLGAGEFNTSDPVSCFLTQGGTSAGPAFAIMTAGKTFIMYGSSNADFHLIPSIVDIGFSAFTGQQVSNDAFGLTARGIQTLITTLTYGDFDYESVSHMIQPLMTRLKGLETCSTTLKTKNQYRIYFSDHTALVIGLTGNTVSGLMALDYGRAVRCICTATLSTGAEVTYFGSDDGYIYQDNVGTSQDGAAIEAWCRLPFNNNKSPMVRKRFLRAVLEVSIDSYSQVNISYDLGYGSPGVQPSDAINTSLTGAGGYWNQFIWDQFNWDSQIVNNPIISIDGTEKNISFLFYSNRAQDASHTLQGITLITLPRRLDRAA